MSDKEKLTEEEERRRQFIDSLDELAEIKHISKDRLIRMIQNALLTAYKQKYGYNQNVSVKIDEEEGDISVIKKMEVVDYVEDETSQVTLERAREALGSDDVEVGDFITYVEPIEDFGRVAARTAKQVMTQNIVEAEREMIREEFSDRKGEMMTAIVRRKNGQTVYVDLGTAEGMLPYKEQVPGENYFPEQRIRVYIKDFTKNTKGPQILVSRKNEGLVARLFELEVPEIKEGIVEVKGIARDPGSRTKMAVYSSDPNVDPVGACVGPRGSRVQRVVDEINGEKIDIVFWSEDPVELISNVLSPGDVEAVIIEDEETKDSKVIVPDDQLSLAIGKGGQNVRLAAQVSGWSIDIKSHSAYYAEEAEEEAGETADETAAEDAAVEAQEAEEAAAEEPAAEEAEAEAEAEEAEEPEAEGSEELADDEPEDEEPEEGSEEEPAEEAKGEQEDD